MCKNINLHRRNPTDKPFVSLRIYPHPFYNPWKSAKTVLEKGFLILSNFGTMVASMPRLSTHGLLTASSMHTASGNVTSTCRGPPQEPLVCRWVVVPGSFDHEKSQTPLIYLFTNFHTFPHHKS